MQKTNDYDIHASKIARLLYLGIQKPNIYIERPAMQSLLPDLRGRKVLCVGCGTGEECSELLSRGAEVWGFDSSAESIRLAKEAFNDIDFTVMDMHELEYRDASFDFIYSGLALHYTEQLEKVLAEMTRVLRPGGVMQFSVGHPIKWAAEFRRDLNNENKKSFLLGYDTYEAPARVYGDYFAVTKMTQKPQNYPAITYWSRPISSCLRIIRESGLELLDFVEPPVILDVKEIDAEYYAIYSRIPQFMIFVARKPIQEELSSFRICSMHTFNIKLKYDHYEY